MMQGNPIVEPIPDEWIDRLFGCMSEFFGQRWDKQFKNDNHKSMHKLIWKNGLHGLEYSQIKKALFHYRAQGLYPHELPPIVTDFYQVAKRFCVEHGANTT